MPEQSPEAASRPAPPLFSEVRYPLPDLLREIDLDRRESALGMDTLDQVEIKKLFANRRQRHVRRKK